MPRVIHKFGNHISTDIIYPGRYMATVLPEETPQYAFADNPELNEKLVNKEVPPESVIVAGINFGCGSSREQAASTIKGHELIMVAKSFARIFLQNAINLGVRTVRCPAIEADVGDEIQFEGGKVINKTTGRKFSTIPLEESQREIVGAGGLIPYVRKRLVKGKS